MGLAPANGRHARRVIGFGLKVGLQAWAALAGGVLVRLTVESVWRGRWVPWHGVDDGLWLLFASWLLVVPAFLRAVDGAASARPEARAIAYALCIGAGTLATLPVLFLLGGGTGRWSPGVTLFMLQGAVGGGLFPVVSAAFSRGRVPS